MGGEERSDEQKGFSYCAVVYGRRFCCSRPSSPPRDIYYVVTVAIPRGREVYCSLWRLRCFRDVAHDEYGAAL